MASQDVAKQNILVLNCGSSSLKYALYGVDEEPHTILAGAVERIGLPRARFHAESADGIALFDRECDIADQEAALEQVLDDLDARLATGSLAAVGHRVAHGGQGHDRPVRLSREHVQQLRELVPLAPLHLPHNLAGIEAVWKHRPGLPQYACFDTAFHHGLPRHAFLTGLPRRFERQGIHKYGFHGLSYEHALQSIRRNEGEVLAQGRLVVAHLGNGASMAAVLAGGSLDTTMAFSPLSGLLMGTRCGDLDPAVVLYLIARNGMTPAAVERLLYQDCGLLGVSGVSRNMHDLLERRDEPAVRDALDLFCYRVRYHLGGLVTALGGLDALVFTGGIGANAHAIREQICDGLDYLGIVLEQERNRAGERRLSPSGAQVTLLAFAADEEMVIARHVQRLLALDRP